ncbi:hypothetical protein Efla_004441 [Eimeria flavescens]
MQAFIVVYSPTRDTAKSVLKNRRTAAQDTRESGEFMYVMSTQPPSQTPQADTFQMFLIDEEAYAKQPDTRDDVELNVAKQTLTALPQEMTIMVSPGRSLRR